MSEIVQKQIIPNRRKETWHYPINRLVLAPDILLRQSGFWQEEKVDHR